VVEVADAGAVDDDGNPVAEPQQKPSEDLLLKKAIEVITKGKSDVASAPETAGGPDKKTGDRPILTPLNVPRPEHQQR
jgi:hypothetical protein